MKKQLKNSVMVALALVASMAMFSCSDDDVPVVTQENEQQNGITTARFTYTVHVVPSSERGRTAGLDGAVVTVSQKGNKSRKTVDENGMAIFNNLIEGDVTVYVEAEGFAAINGVNTLSKPSSFENRDRDKTVELSESDVIYLPALGARVKGNLVWDDDADGTTPEVAASGIQVRFELDNTNIQPNVYYATTEADGSFSFDNLPNAEGTVSADTALTVDDQIMTYSFSEGDVNPQLGDFLDLGQNTLSKSSGTFVENTGAVRIRIWGEFDAREDSTVRDEQEELIQPTMSQGQLKMQPTVVVDDNSYPSTLQKEFAGSYDATGQVWTFTGLPVGYDLEIEYLYEVTLPLGESNCIKSDTTPNNYIVEGFSYDGTFYTVCDASDATTYSKVFVYKGLSGITDFSLSSNETMDFGEIRATK